MEQRLSTPIYSKTQWMKWTKTVIRIKLLPLELTYQSDYSSIRSISTELQLENSILKQNLSANFDKFNNTLAAEAQM
ncbi:17377_t:CDS:2 [Funneliformis geosporum]|nr:17377_t:CDS:2 [Funneliformis geosporum]